MDKDGRQSGGPEQVASNREAQRDAGPAPGKVTRTSRLSPARGPAVQRKAAGPAGAAAGPQARSAWDLTTDSSMDAAHRGATALAESGQGAGPIQARADAGARASGGSGSAVQLQPAPSPAPVPGMALPPPGPAPAVPQLTPYERALDGQTPWTRALAEQAMNAYGALAAADRAAWIRRWSPRGQIGPMLRALNRPDVAYGGRYENTVRDIQQRIQRTEAIAEAAAQGISSEADMAQEQANFMHAANVAAATAAQAPGSGPPTPAQVAAQQQGQVASTSIAPQTQTLTPAREQRLTREANAAVTAFVRWANTNRRSLPITAANFRVAVREVFDRGEGIIAFADGGTPPKCVVGEAFISAVTRNPAYALPTVVHELWGHNEYGEYGDPGVEYGLELYDKAAARMPGYTQPTGDDRLSEIDAYAYQETEIYSLMREVEYYTPNAPRHRAALDQINYDPKPAIGDRIALIVQQWEPRVARSMVRGLLQRFRVDPRLVPAAIRAFEDGVRAHFPAADAAQIVR
jgi:hypothetical protein